MNQKEPTMWSLVSVVADECRTRAVLCAAVLETLQCHVVGFSTPEAAKAAHQTYGASLTIAICDNPPGCTLFSDSYSGVSDHVHTIVFTPNPSQVCAKAPNGVVIRKISDVAEAASLVRPLLSELVSQGRLQTAFYIMPSSEDRELLSKLTVRELEILELTGKGHSLQQIADIINREMTTVISHRRRIMIKTGLRNRVALARLAIRTGMVRL